MSAMSVIGLAVYAIVAACCLAAALAADPARGGERRFWWGAVLVMALLALGRAAGWEDFLRGAARALARSNAAYDERLALQLPATLAVLAAAAVLALWWWRRWRMLPSRSRRRALLLATAGLAGFVPLYALRLVSWHALDRVLYAGPLRLNWLLEAALCAAVALGALLYARRSRARRGASAVR